MVRLWWLSFADASKPRGQQFLGACIVPVRFTGDARADFRDAIDTSHLLRCNPGGEVLARAMTAEATSTVGGEWITRVLTWEECKAFEREMEQRGLHLFEGEA